MILWVLFAVAALPIVCLSLKGLFVVATEGGKPPLPITPGVAYGEGGVCLEFGEVKAWDVDLGEFMSEIEEAPDAATMLGGGGEFDLETTATSDAPGQSADLASESQIGGDSSFFDKSQGPADSSFFRQSVGGSAVQGGSLGGSFGSDIDLKSLVAGSAIADDAAAESIVAPDSLAGSDLLGDDLAVAEPAGAEGSGILVDDSAYWLLKAPYQWWLNLMRDEDDN